MFDPPSERLRLRYHTMCRGLPEDDFKRGGYGRSISQGTRLRPSRAVRPPLPARGVLASAAEGSVSGIRRSLQDAPARRGRGPGKGRPARGRALVLPRRRRVAARERALAGGLGQAGGGLGHRPASAPARAAEGRGRRTLSSRTLPDRDDLRERPSAAGGLERLAVRAEDGPRRVDRRSEASAI